MKRITLILLAVCLTKTLLAQQTIDSVLQSIEQNNTVLSALRQQTEADKTGNKTGIYLENPEVEFHYLWGNNAEAGNRIDFSASQSFDFPTAYHYKRKVADSKNQQLDLLYQMERQKILLEAQNTSITLIYLNAMLAESQMRLQNANQIASAYQSKFDKGEVNVLDLNKAKLNYLNAQKTFDALQVERESQSAVLSGLNGGIAIEITMKEYAPKSLPSDFENYYSQIKANNIQLKYLQKQTEIGQQAEKLQRSLNLPKFSAGYMSEKTIFDHFQGVTVGVSIPLFENKNTVKQIKIQTAANEALEQDANLRYRNESKALYDKALKLKKMIDGYTESLSVSNNYSLLKKALDAGEISLIDYMLELSIYYEAVNNLLETQKDYQLTVAELNRVLF